MFTFYYRMTEHEIRAMMQKERLRTEGGDAGAIVVEDKKNFDERTLATFSTTDLIRHQVNIF